jgi:hypothetical protein
MLDHDHEYNCVSDSNDLPTDNDYDSDHSVDPIAKEEQQKHIVRRKVSKIQSKFASILALKTKKGVSHHATNRGISDFNILMPPSLLEENVHTLPASPVKLEKYFGSSARGAFLSKINVAYQEESIKGTGKAAAAFKQTAFLPSKEEYVDIPFAPRRPVKEDKERHVCVDPLGDVSCLDGCDDRPPGVCVDAPSSFCSLDYQETDDYRHAQPPSPRTAFISGCIQEKLNPRASLLLRKNVSKELNLQHQGALNIMYSIIILIV